MSFLRFLYDKQIINDDLYEIASEKGPEADSYISKVLISTGDFSDEDIAKLKSEFLGLEYTNLDKFEIFNDINYKDLEELSIIPFKSSLNRIYVAISDQNDVVAKNTLNYNLSLCKNMQNPEVIYCIASKEKIKQKFKEINHEKSLTIDRILYTASMNQASDIHITPYIRTFKIQFRIDGELSDYKTLDIKIFNSLKNSIKVLAKLDISETRRPQSGSFMQDQFDFRVSTHPTIYGENLVIRILNKDKSLISIEKIGFNEEHIDYLKRVCDFANGLIIFCGPTGSGKTTSIYSLIETMDKTSRNIMTLEDPIEYKIPNVRQTEIINGVIDFVDGMKSILRQDPDVILIGEIRDKETAQMAIRASMTGHLVFTTLHANDSFGAISRLREFDITSSLIAENVIAVISQRLVKKASGMGRIIVSEILKMNSKIGSLIINNANKFEIKRQAIADGFRSLEDDCNEKIKRKIIKKNDVRNILRCS